MKSNIFKIVSVIATLSLAALACGLAVPNVTTNPTAQPPVVNNNNDNGGGGLNNNGNNGGTNNNGNGNGGGVGGQKLFSDNFEGRNSNWGTGTDTDSAVEYVNGALQFDIFTTNLIVYSGPNDTTYSNVHLEVDVQNNSTDPKAAFGLICNQQFIHDSFYYAYITPTGAYGIVKAIFVQNDLELTAGSSNLIPQNASSYNIGLDCGNGTITLYVNGQQIDTASDSEYTDGLVGVVAWSGKVPSGTSVAFDNFSIVSLP